MSQPPQFDRTTDDYRLHRPDFSPKLYARLRAAGIGLPGQAVLDCGAGTGLFSNPLVQASSIVTAVDVGFSLLRHAAAARVVARTEALPFESESFDVVTAAQCWHWFDRTLAPRETFRVLKPQGILAVIYQTYIPLPGTTAEQTERLILQHQPRWRHANSTGINGQVLRDVQVAGFREIESFSFDVEINFSRDAWAGFIRTTSAVGASMSAAQIAAFNQAHESLLRNAPQTFTIPHRVFAVVTKRP